MNSKWIATLSTLATVLACLCQTTLAGGGGTNLPTQITSSSPVMGDRLLRSGAGSSCGSVKPYPGTFAAGTYPYQTLGLVKVAATGCVTFTFQTAGACGASGVHLSAYNGVFNPRDLSVGYLGDSGFDSVLGSNQPMSLDLAANQSIGLIVNSNDSGNFGPCAVTVNTLQSVEPRIFTVFVGDVPSRLPPITNRIIRNSVASTCDVPKFYPGTQYGGTYPIFKFFAAAPASACAKVTASIAGSGCPTEQVHPTAYHDEFYPDILSVNYLGDSGTSALIGAPSPAMSVIVGPDVPMVLVANLLSSSAVSPCTVSLSAFDVVNDQVFASGFEG